MYENGSFGGGLTCNFCVLLFLLLLLLTDLFIWQPVNHGKEKMKHRYLWSLGAYNVIGRKSYIIIVI